jgi:hypothetical protein
VAEEAEKKRIAEESEQQEILAVEAEQEEPEPDPVFQTEDIQEAEEPEEQSPEQQSATEVVVVQQPDVKVEINQQQAIEKAGEKDSKIGLKILFVFMLLLLIYTAYRVFGIVISIIKGDK